ncbi:MAG: RecQ family zinc-binding domain-containing protein, partial [Bacteroides sp.]
DSPEAYFQEAGRAGRDGEKAYAVILHSRSDKATLHRRIPDTFPDKDYIKEVYEHLQYYYQMAMGDGQDCVKEFNLEEFCRTFKYFPVPAHSALKILTQAGYLEYTDEQDNASRIIFTIRREELYKLREMPGEAEKLLQTILRAYTGLFTDYAYISEPALSVYSGMPVPKVYELLKVLAKRHIIDYIPHKKTPYIIYTRERMDRQRLHLSRSVYEDRKERYETRIRAMVEYVTSESICRSRMLLRYFGETDHRNCGQCDVCLSGRATAELPDDLIDEVKEQISALTGEQPLTPADLADRLHTNRDTLTQTIQYLVDEKELEMKNGLIGTKE